MIRRVAIQNFKSFAKLDVDLGPFAVIVGQNNSGKTNFIKIILFVRELIGGKSVSDALMDVFGTDSNAVFLGEGVSNDSFWVELDFSFKSSGGADYRYRLDIMDEHITPYIKSEKLINVATDELLLEAGEGKGKSFVDKNKAHEFPVDKTKATLSQLKKLQSNEALLQIRAFFHDIWFFDFEPQELRRMTHLGEFEKSFHPYGLGLAERLYEIKSDHPEIFVRIQDGLKQLIPEIEEIDVKLTLADSDPAQTANDTRKTLVHLTFKERHLKGLFTTRNVSDGFLKSLALVTLIFSPELPPVILIEEIDKSIHFRRLRDIVSMLRLVTRVQKESPKDQHQIILSTHNPYLVDLMKPEELLVADKFKGETLLRSLSSQEQKMKIVKSFLTEGASLGELWFRGSLGGVPQDEDSVEK